MPESILLKEPGTTVTAKATAAVTGGRFVRISGNRTGGGASGLSADLANLIQVGPITAAGQQPIGVAKQDAASGSAVQVHLLRGGIATVEAGATLAGGDVVQADSIGRAVPLAGGAAGGICLTAATIGQNAELLLIGGGGGSMVAQGAAVASLTDNSGGAANDVIQDVPAAYAEADLANNFADLAAKVNTILARLRSAGIIAP